MFYIPLGKKVEKETKFLGKRKVVLFPSHRIEDPLEFCDYLMLFARSVHITRYSHFKSHKLENVGQVRDVQHSQWRHSMANT